MDNKNVFVAIALSMSVLLFWAAFFEQPRQINNENQLARGEFPFNPNGSQDDIAALTNKNGNVLALMPHPERAFYHYQTP